MSPKRMRYRWFQDVPRNVTRREYQQLTFRTFCTIGLGLTAAILAVASIFGLTMQTSRELAEIDRLSIAEAIAYEGDLIDLIQVEGSVVADTPLTMPDNDTQKVIQGRVKLSARTNENSGTEGDEPPPKETLFAWEEQVESVFLSDGDQRIPLAFDLGVLPMENDLGEVSPRTIREGDIPRTRRPVAIKYGEQSYSLPLGTWGEIDSVFTDLERQILPDGQSVVVVASLETTAKGNQLIDPLGDRLRVLIGTEAEIRQEGQQLRVQFLVLAIPLGVASFMVARSAQRLRQTFVERSNQ